MARIPEEVVRDIRAKAKIEDVIGHYLDVEKKGRNYVALCPFHDDHDPSLSISVDKQVFKCFACGAAGDVFGFVQKYEQVDYPTAIRKVAELIGYSYDFGPAYRQPEFVETPLHKAMREAVVFCQHELNSRAGAGMREYLHHRQLTDDIIERYQMGYNPPDNVMHTFLSRKGYEDKVLIEANLARLTDRGVQDVFKDRLMIPIHDAQGHPIAFTARTLDPNVPSKYINTTDTPLFKKSEVLFNFHRAGEPIRRQKQAILCEGPMDVIAFDRAGLANAVCSMGTSCTKGQLAALRRLTGNLLLAFDGDDAGQNAIYKVGRLAQQQGFAVMVLNNPGKADPDEIVNQQSGRALAGMAAKPKTWMEFIFDYFRGRFDLNNYTQKKQFAQAVLQEIGGLSDRFDRDHYLQQLAALTGFSASALQAEAPRPAAPDDAGSVVTVRPAGTLPSGLRNAENTILRQMMVSARQCHVFMDELGMLPDQKANELAHYLIDYYHGRDEFVLADFIGSLENEELRSMAIGISEDPLLVAQANPKVMQDAIGRVRISLLEEQIAKLKTELESYSDPHVQSSISTQIAGLRRQQNAIRRASRVSKKERDAE